MSASHDISFLDDLNPVQRAAVTDIEGPSLIVAGAGSGKTRVLTYKIAYLLSQGVRPWNILALTFTNKAAREMRSRIAKLVGEDKARQLNMGTFHSVFAGILRREAVAIGYTPDYTIYDTQDSKSLLKSLCKEMQLDEKIYKPSAVLSRISLAKNRLLSPQFYAADTDIMQQDKTARMYRMPEIYKLYQQRLRSANAMDFDDLLVNTFLLLNQNQQIRERYQQHYQYLLVDEYQDTNHVQYMIIRLLAAPDNRISVVGDDAQSIYSFRGAEIENILGYKNDFQDAHLYKLEQNYRSTKNIVGAANSLIAKNQAQIQKNLFSDGDMGDCISIQAYEYDRQEASSVAQSIAGKNKRHTSLDDMAVLYRTNAQSRTLEDELRKRGIAYRIYGGLAFYQRKEVKDMLAYLRLCSNLRDEESLLRIINLPARGIGDTTMKKVAEAAHALQKPVFEVVKDPVGNGVVVTSSTKKRLVEFAGMVLGWRDKMQQLNAMEFADMVMRESQLMSAAMTDISVEGRDRYENMKELLNSISEFVQREQTEGSGAVTLQDFLTEVSLMTDQDQKIDDRQPRVTLMTVHAAKGLEFPVVYVVGMENNLFPSPFADSLKAIEEERRLFYVAITRAKEQCYISYSKTRYINGKNQMQSESPFLRDIDARYVKRIDSTSGNSPFFSGWNSWYDIAEPSRPATRFQSSDTQLSGQHSEKNLRPITSSAAGDRQDIVTDFPVDSYVIHKTFGRGRVLRTYKENDNENIEILFDTAGQKKLLLKFAKLQHCQ